MSQTTQEHRLALGEINPPEPRWQKREGLTWDQSNSMDFDIYCRGVDQGLEMAREIREPHLKEAWAKGEKAAERKLKDRISKAISDHWDRAFSEAEAFFLRILNDGEIEPHSVHLRSVSQVPFDVEMLFVIPFDEYLSDKMAAVYEAAAHREDKFRPAGSKRSDDVLESFEVHFRFLPLKETTNWDRIWADGFRYSYDRTGES
jgi:hypothetical protein